MRQPTGDGTLDGVEGHAEGFRTLLKRISNVSGRRWEPLPQKEDPPSSTWDHPATEVLLELIHDQNDISRKRHGWIQGSAPVITEIQTEARE
jgi:hypothetical protein